MHGISAWESEVDMGVVGMAAVVGIGIVKSTFGMVNVVSRVRWVGGY